MKPTKKQKTTLNSSRYTDIIISIIIFLLLILSILGISLYSTYQIHKNEKIVNTTAQMRDLSHSITSELFGMQLSYGQDPNSPYISASLNRLEYSEKKFTEDLKALDAGGFITDYAGRNIDIEILSIPEEREYLRIVANQWMGFSEKIKNYIPSATDINANSSALDLAVLKAEESGIIIYDALDKLVNSVRKRSEDQADILHNIQLIGIVFVLVYFVIFMFYFMRKLKSVDKIATMARRETDKIMATVNEGLFLVNKDLTIGMQYSNRLESLIGQKKIANRNFENLLSSIVSMGDLDTSKKFIAQLFNKKVKEKLVQDLNPLDEVRASIREETGNMKDRYLKFNFSRVYNENSNEIEAILVSIADNTRAVELEKRLEHEKKYNQQQVDMLASILHTDNESMLEFIKNTSVRLETINQILRKPKLSRADLISKVNLTYREIHSLKGESSALGLEKFVQLAHESEEQLQLLKNNNKISGNDFLPLTVSIEKLMTSFDSIKEVNSMLLERTMSEEKFNTKPDQLLQPQNKNRNYLYFEKATQDIASREQKKVNFNCTSIQDSLLQDKRGSMIKDIATQLIRNAVVHGIEQSNERIRMGKHQEGEVKMALIQKDKDHGLLVISDDGGGFSYDKIRQKLIDNGTYTKDEAHSLKEKKLIKEIFKPGFSTANTVSEDAGRGVGLDIVIGYIKALDGKLSIKSNPNSYTTFSITYHI